MADTGNTNTPPNTDYPFTLDNGTARTILFTMPETGTAQSISFWGNTAAGVGYLAAIYDGATAGNLLTSESSAASPGAQTGAWTTISLTGYELTGSTQYLLAIGSNSGTASTVYSGGNSNTGQSDFYWGGSWADPDSFLNGSAASFAIYLTYTTGGGDPEGRLIGGKLIRGGLLRSGVL